MNPNLASPVKFAAAVLAQVVVLAALVIFNLIPIARGTLVELAIRPFDPTDPLRGDYLTFTYDISRLNAGLIRQPPIKQWDMVYVELVQSRQLWTARGIYKTPPPNVVFIKGRVTNNPDLTKSVSLAYGIEQYFVPEGMGSSRVLFAPARVSAVVSVGPDGTPQIRRLMVDSRPWP